MSLTRSFFHFLNIRSSDNVIKRRAQERVLKELRAINSVQPSPQDFILSLKRCVWIFLRPIWRGKSPSQQSSPIHAAAG
ncbi:hypothetical protein CJR81_004127 [Salmonella enterica subsp. enterica serovar Javiana]|nr:hypothetical protein [Salmonella enterica]EDR1539099.1 hypothetical protein [Salmonella enterica subsp. enterica serovar Javiana]